MLETAHLTSVNILKIDAEGHELQVLKGAEAIINQFKPTILYENIAGFQVASAEVREFLISHHYQLFTYNPLLRALLPVDPQTTSKSLNIIAQAQR